MTSIPFISFDAGEKLLDWINLTDALAQGHTRPKAQIGDTFLYRDPDTLLSRAAWIDGMGIAVKSATIFPRNVDSGRPNINGGVNLYSDTDGTLEAIIDFHLVTKWKTAGDSLLSARRLARPDATRILLVGAGTVAQSLHAAYSAAFPNASFTVWSRTQASADVFAEKMPNVAVAADLETAVGGAEIIGSATMTTEPVIKGAWLQEGQHIDLIGAYRPDMREVDDEALRRARLFVDSFDTTLDHIGEIKIPLESGAITREHIIADYYDLDAFKRTSDSEITICKNGGGAHLDLMTSRYILDQWHNAAS
ncbi:ornithine cyclodeaminase [uncultured Sulfitobacter sp.]|uniref:ornithine cyclodeaminase family protein n=1 Tax=uncultured Sulfitobacter sp. TaxID=191468 RepID=UPI0026299A9A|nr:ornithine cyclodeaminase [uncultured Sulfitobacter sp.]